MMLQLTDSDLYSTVPHYDPNQTILLKWPISDDDRVKAFRVDLTRQIPYYNSMVAQESRYRADGDNIHLRKQTVMAMNSLMEHEVKQNFELCPRILLFLSEQDALICAPDDTCVPLWNWNKPITCTGQETPANGDGELHCCAVRPTQ